MAVIHGLGDCRHRSPDVLDLAQAGTSSVSLPCAPSELAYGVENPRLQLVDFMGEIICPTRPIRPHCPISVC